MSNERKCSVCSGELPADPISVSGLVFCSDACGSIYGLVQLAGRMRSEASARKEWDGDEGYDGKPRPCVACDTETRLRCSICRLPICHNCEECPNGCENSSKFLYGENELSEPSSEPDATETGPASRPRS
jgi:hypothetical protein